MDDARVVGRGEGGGERIGRWSLRLDAAYCFVLGSLMMFAAPSISPTVSVPAGYLVVLGAVVIAWAALILLMLRGLELRTALRAVMVANLGAAVAVAAFSTVGAAVFVALSVLAIAADIALFAGSQAFALRRMRLGR
ncbi:MULTISPECIES: hypothetical protein [unclassified Brevibacterium]|uniref:hypothetical protein n=1 Tax=unclassified Brevibacterium TaxID=2614124 RepID=UPI001E360135|nr:MULTISPECIES: hypothetical protein [unclassified Brevibacterium]MDK8435025.1 hypothetical protein [Brevibacterium sp. H-BE7]